MSLLVRGSVRASSTTTGPSAAKISSIIGSPLTGIRGATSQIEVLTRAAVAEDADAGRACSLVGDAQPGVIEADRVAHLGPGHVQDLDERGGALQLAGEREQPRADGKQGAVHVSPMRCKLGPAVR